MLGYFGKNYVSPAPKAPPEEVIAEINTPVTSTNTSLKSREVSAQQRIANTRSALLRSKMDLLRSEIVSSEQAKRAKLQALHNKQAAQAAYGRGATSKGKRTESEIAIGVSSGYYGGMGSFSGSSTEIASIQAIEKATRLVKSLTEDIKTGSATAEELELAMRDLTVKTKKAEKLVRATSLEGYTESSIKTSLLLAGLVALALLLLRS